MHIDPAMLSIILTFIIIFVIGIALRYLKQPYVVAYIISGIILGPHVTGLISNPTAIVSFGDLGVIILLFFLGMELSLKDLAESWKTALVVVLGQISISLIALIIIGNLFDWSFSRSLLLAYVISLSSTAVIVKLLEEWNEINTEVGKNIIGILILQDILLAPMLVTSSMAGGLSTNYIAFSLQILGTIIIGLIIKHLLTHENIKLPFARILKKDHELQTFSAFFICFGGALLTSIINLSSGLGAFLGGMIVSSAKETDWIQSKLESLKILFIALFFVSVGLILDINFVLDNFLILLALITVILVTKSLTMSILLKSLGYSWIASFYAGAVLSQIGEFSFVLAATGRSLNIVSDFAYQMTIALITLSLLISPLWIYTIKKLTASKQVILE